MKHKLVLALILSAIAFSSLADVPKWQKGAEVNNLVKNWWDKIPDGHSQLKSQEFKLRWWPTEGSDHIPTRAKGATHIQGLAFSHDKWAVSYSDKNILDNSCKNPKWVLILGDSTGKTLHKRLGKTCHPGGGIQIMGGVLIAGDEKNTSFYDIRNLNSFRELACKIPQGGAAGIAWHPGLGIHVAVVGSGGGDQLYASNGKSLSDRSCQFEKLGAVNRLSAAGEGFSQLFYDRATKEIVAVGGWSKSGEKMRVNAFNLTRTDEEVGFVSYGKTKDGKNIQVNQIDEVEKTIHNSSGIGSFAWAGSVSFKSNQIGVIVPPRNFDRHNFHALSVGSGKHSGFAIPRTATTNVKKAPDNDGRDLVFKRYKVVDDPTAKEKAARAAQKAAFTLLIGKAGADAYYAAMEASEAAERAARQAEREAAKAEKAAKEKDIADAEKAAIRAKAAAARASQARQNSARKGREAAKVTNKLASEAKNDAAKKAAEEATKAMARAKEAAEKAVKEANELAAIAKAAANAKANPTPNAAAQGNVILTKTSVYQLVQNRALSGHNTKRLSNKTVNECMAACDAMTSFKCQSIDYHKNKNKCDLSDKLPAVKSLSKYKNSPYDHYARVFIKSANAAIRGHNNVKLKSKTVGECSVACATETSFECRSFDYHKNTKKCDLSSKTQKMVGGLTKYKNNPYDHYEYQR